MANVNMQDIDDTSWRYPLESQHLTSHTKIIGQDIDLFRRMVWESMIAVGIKVEFYKCLQSKKDLYKDSTCLWDDMILVDAIFEDNPKVKILKELGWYNEDEEIRAPIIYLPMYLDWQKKTIFEVTDNSLIKVHYFGEIATADFRITEKKMDSVYGCYWVCKLAPERLEYFEKIQDNGSYYLKRNESREEEKCEHSYATDKETEENNGIPLDNRVYNHSDFNDYTNKVQDSTQDTEDSSDTSDAYDFSKW